MQRREFLVGAAALPLMGMPFAGLFARRDRFAEALEVVINEKARERKVIIPVGAARQRVSYRGKVAAVAEHVYQEIDELPWWRVTFNSIVKWVKDHWDEILAVLTKIGPAIFLLLL